MIRRTIVQKLLGNSPATFLGFALTLAVLIASMWIADENLRSLADSSHLEAGSRWINLLTGGIGLILVFSALLLVRRSEAFQREASECIDLERERLRVTMQSIGDGLIVTDALGLVTAMNPVAETLTGWPESEALGLPLDVVFNIVNMETRLPVAIPAIRAIREGIVVGLANHTILIARDGKEWPLDDSGAPIREGDRIVGAVLVFREVSARYAAEKAIEDAKRFAENIVDTVREPLVVLDAEQRVVSVNDSFVTTFRVPRIEIAGRLLRELGNGQWNIPVLRDLLDTLIPQHLVVTDFEVVHDFPEIGRRRMLLNARKIQQPGNDSALILLAFEDVTDRNRAELALVQSEARLRFTIDNVRDYAIFPIGTDATIVGWNLGAERVFGWPENAIVGQPFAALFTPEDREADKPATELRQAVLTGRGIDERWHNRQDGSLFFASGVVTPVHDEAGTLQGYTKIARDITEQKRRETEFTLVREESERRERLYGTILDTIPDLVYVFDLDHRFTYANAALLEVWGRTLADVVGKNCLDLEYPVWEAEMHSSEIERVRATRMPIRGDVAHEGTRGIRDYDYIFVPVIGADGSVEAIAGTTRDVTDRREDERRSLESRLFLRSALDALDAHIAILDERGIILEVNRAWQQFATMNGYTGEAFGIGQNYLESCESADGNCASDGAKMGAGIRGVIEGASETYVAEYPCHSPGEERWYLMRVTRFTGGDPVRVVISHENITPRIKYERATLNQSVKLRRLTGSAAHVNAANDVRSVIGVVLEEARVLTGSNQAVALVSPDVVGGVAVHRASFPERSEAAYQPLIDGSDIFSLSNRFDLPLRMSEEALDAHPGFEAYRLKYADRPRMHGLLAAAMIGRDGLPMGLVELSDKIEGEFTEDDQNLLVQLTAIASVAIDNARLVEQLVDADERKNEFLAMLAHELRNPLAPIRNAVQIMNIAADDPKVIEQSRVIIERQLQQMVRLVDDLLDISRVNRGKIALQTQTIDVADVLSSAIEQARLLIDSQNHELTVELPGVPLVLIADEMRLTQVVGNLITNAAKYTERGGKIVVSARREGTTAVVSVRDNGVGLPTEMLSSVFDMFTQVDTSLERSQGGLGIGLTLVKRLVEMHDGSVEARSDGPGKGSEFIVRLPALASRTNVPDKPRAVIGPVSRSILRILVADDNVDSADSLSMMLEIVGNVVATANDGQAAVDLAETFRPDVILTDIGMPRLNGYEVARLVRSKPWASKVVIVALTGWGKDEDRTRTGEAGFDHHLVKPIDIKTLNAVLAGVKPRSEA